MAVGDLATARAATLFLFERQQQADGSMPRNSLVNGKTAPDSFGTQLDETAYPTADGRRAAPHRRLALREPHQARRELRRQPRPRLRRRALGGAGRLLAVDDRRRDRRPRRGRRSSRDANGDPVSAAVWRGVADDYQRSIKGWTVTTTGPLAAALLHPPLEDRRPERRDLVQRRQRRADARPARRDRRRLPRARARSASCPPTTRTSSRSLAVVDATIRSRPRAGRAGTATTATATATAPSDGRPWAPSGQGTGHLWPALSAERGEQTLQTRATRPARPPCSTRMSRFASGVGLIPEQDWERPGPRGVAVRHRPDTRVHRVRQRRARRLGVAAHLVGRVVRAARRRPRRRPARRSAGAARSSATSRTRRATTTLTVTSPADNCAPSTGSPVTVTGTTAPGNAVYVLATNTDAELRHDERLDDGRRRRRVQRRRRR